ncbi:hypothetical protein A8O28_16995 [Enterobacteriaceae bacterium CCUG 67584]|nr:hypothetical protein [Enterobacteriaceae bacterium CCUG 67584]
MALSILEKIALQKQAAGLKGELKSGTLSIMEKLGRQRELAVIMATLKGDTKPAPVPTPEPTPEPGTGDEEGTDEEAETEASRSVQGFELAGVTHPAWTKPFANKAGLYGGDVVVSNEGLNIAIILVLSGGKSLSRDDLKIAWPDYIAGTSKVEDYLSMPAQRAWDGVYSPFPPKMRKKVRRLVEQGLKVAERAFSEGIGEYRLTLKPGASVEITLGNESASDWTVGAAAARLKLANQGLEVVAGMLTQGDARAARAKLFEELAKLDHNANDLTSEERTKAIEELRALMTHPDIGITADTIKDALDKLVALQPEAEPETTLSERFMRGDFNTDAPELFRTRILAVADEGLVLDDVKTGVNRWIEANPELIAA